MLNTLKNRVALVNPCRCWDKIAIGEKSDGEGSPYCFGKFEVSDIVQKGMNFIRNERSKVIKIIWNNLFRNRPLTNKFKLSTRKTIEILYYSVLVVNTTTCICTAEVAFSCQFL